MDITGEMTERLSLDEFPSAAGQGAIAIVAKEGNTEVIKILQSVEDKATRAEITAERSLVLKLEGGCRVPIGAVAQANGNNLTLFGSIFSLKRPQKNQCPSQRHTRPSPRIGHQSWRRPNQAGCTRIRKRVERKIWRMVKSILSAQAPATQNYSRLKLLRHLKEADVVIYDRLGVSEDVLCLAPDNAERIFVGKRTGLHEVPQDQITNIIIEKAKQGGKIVRLKGGDPFIFGRGGEEAEALVAEGIEFEIIPGISSSVSAPMYAGIPLTHRDYAASVAIITGHRAGDAEKPVDWVKIANAVDTMVILMGVESLEGIVGKLLAGGISPEQTRCHG